MAKQEKMNMPENGARPTSHEYSPEIVRAAMDQAFKDITRDVPAPQSIQHVASIGLDAATAAIIYGQVRSAIKMTRRRTAMVLMISGALWLLASLVAWAVTGFAWATAKADLIRVLALLAAIGAVLLLTGFFRWRRASRL